MWLKEPIFQRKKKSFFLFPFLIDCYLILKFNMALFNPLAVIVKENKLTGPNDIDWKRNVDIVLIAKGYKYVLSECCPPNPA